MGVKKGQLETGVERRTGSRLGRECVRAVYSHLACLSCAECIMCGAGLDEAQAGIKISRRNINNLRYVDDITLTAQSEEEVKNLLMKVKEESEKMA